MASAAVMSGSEWSVLLKCTTCDPLTAADKPPSSEWRHRGQEVLLQRVKEEVDAAACLAPLCSVIKRITSLTVGQCGKTLQSSSLQYYKLLVLSPWFVLALYSSEKDNTAAGKTFD